MTKRILIPFIGLLLGVIFSWSPSYAQNFADWRPMPKPQVEREKPAKTEDKISESKKGDSTDQIDDALKRVAAEENSDLPADPEAQLASQYTLGATDEIEIKVMRHPEVSGKYEINQEGKIQYEFIGDVKISGLTKEDAEKMVAEKLAEYIISPEVSIKITGYNSKVVYVVGEVGRPGKIFMRGDTISIREALMAAGLPELTGVTRKSRLITPSDKGKGAVKTVDVYALLYEGDLTQNYTMKPGDVIFIPATFLTKAMRAIQPVAAPIGTAAGTGRTVTTGY